MLMDSLAALADPTRRRIIELLAQRELSAGEIAGRFEISAPALSPHLKVLREGGRGRVGGGRSGPSTSCTPAASASSTRGSAISASSGAAGSTRASAG